MFILNFSKPAHHYLLFFNLVSICRVSHSFLFAVDRQSSNENNADWTPRKMLFSYTVIFQAALTDRVETSTVRRDISKTKDRTVFVQKTINIVLDVCKENHHIIVATFTCFPRFYATLWYKVFISNELYFPFSSRNESKTDFGNVTCSGIILQV